MEKMGKSSHKDVPVWYDIPGPFLDPKRGRVPARDWQYPV